MAQPDAIPQDRTPLDIDAPLVKHSYLKKQPNKQTKSNLTLIKPSTLTATLQEIQGNEPILPTCQCPEEEGRVERLLQNKRNLRVLTTRAGA